MWKFRHRDCTIQYVRQCLSAVRYQCCQTVGSMIVKKNTLIFIVVAILFCHVSVINCQLTTDFYNQTCPNLDSIVGSTFVGLARKDNVVAPSALRLINHDCFVQGCDASILISSTLGNIAERDAVENNLPQQAFDTIETIKATVESACPGVVSCADIIALAARDAVVFLSGPFWQVPLGRRDALISQEENVRGNIPTSNLNVSQLLSIFTSKGLDPEDLVALSGSHTIGFSTCKQFVFRFNNTKMLDPTLDPAYAQQLLETCPANEGEKVVPFDPASPFLFDNSYYTDLQAGRGLLFSDQTLFVDNSTNSWVNLFASSQNQFFQSFINAMVKMSSIGVLMGNNGEIRRDCSTVNPVQSMQT